MVTGSSLAGSLLVASPALDDPNFARAVILLLDHDADGALGVILNRPSGVAAQDALPRWAEVASKPAVLHVGGPVTPQVVVCLGRAKVGASPDGWTQLAGPIGAVDLERSPDDVVSSLDGLRLFAGYAGWGPGQLETELRLGGWLVVAAQPDDAFTASPDTLWSRVLRRQGGELAMLHTMPIDPTQN